MVDLEDILPRFFNTAEFDQKSRFIAGLYVGLLARDAEFNGFMYQRDALLQGIVTQQSLVGGFLGVPEWKLRFGTPADTEFVKLLYDNVLLRTGTASEINGHAANLAAGQRARSWRRIS